MNLKSVVFDKKETFYVDLIGCHSKGSQQSLHELED